MRVPVAAMGLVLLLSGCIPGGDEGTPVVLAPERASTPMTMSTARAHATDTPLPSATAAQTATERPSTTAGVRSWPEGCEPEQVDAFVAGFLDAFNRGDVEALRGMLPDEDATPRNVLLGRADRDPADVEGVPVALDWFSVPHNGVEGDFPTQEHYVLAKEPEEVLAFAAASHAAGVRLHLRNIMHAGDYLPTTVTFGVEATLEMPGQPDEPWLGKAGIDCGHQRLFLWSIGPDGRQSAAPTDRRMLSQLM